MAGKGALAELGWKGQAHARRLSYKAPARSALTVQVRV